MSAIYISSIHLAYTRKNITYMRQGKGAGLPGSQLIVDCSKHLCNCQPFQIHMSIGDCCISEQEVVVVYSSVKMHSNYTTRAAVLHAVYYWLDHLKSLQGKGITEVIQTTNTCVCSPEWWVVIDGQPEQEKPEINLFCEEAEAFMVLSAKAAASLQRLDTVFAMPGSGQQARVHLQLYCVQTL